MGPSHDILPILRLVNSMIQGKSCQKMKNKSRTELSCATITPRGRSRTAATCKVELFVIIVNGVQSLTIITKSSTLDVTAVLDPPLTPDMRQHDDSSIPPYTQDAN